MEKADDICVYIATYAKTWKLLGKMTAEEPPSDDANGHWRLHPCPQDHNHLHEPWQPFKSSFLSIPLYTVLFVQQLSVPYSSLRDRNIGTLEIEQRLICDIRAEVLSRSILGREFRPHRGDVVSAEHSSVATVPFSTKPEAVTVTLM